MINMGHHQKGEPDTIQKASNTRVPLSEVQNLPNHVRTQKSQALQNSGTLVGIEHADVSDVQYRRGTISRVKASTLHTGSAHVQQKPRSTLGLRHDTDTKIRTRQRRPVSLHLPSSGPSPSSYSIPSSSSSSKHNRSSTRATSSRSASSKSLQPKRLFTTSTRHQNFPRPGTSRPRTVLLHGPKLKAHSTRVQFPDPHAAPPDFYAAARWRQVRARLAAMTGPPTFLTPSVSGTNATESNGKFEEVLAYFSRAQGSSNPQFCATVTAKQAVSISSEPQSLNTVGSSVQNFLLAIERTIFRGTDQSDNGSKPYDAWTTVPPRSEQLILDTNTVMQQELNIASVTFGLDANRTYFSSKSPDLCERPNFSIQICSEHISSTS